MFERIIGIMTKEFILSFRDAKMRGIIIGTPLMQLMLFGYAVSTDVRNVELCIMDYDNTPASREFFGLFTGSDYFRVVDHTLDEKRAQYLVDRGKVKAVIRVNAGFSADLAVGRTAQVQLILDGSDSNSARIAADYIVQTMQSYARDSVRGRLLRLTGRSSEEPVVLDYRAWFNENLESRNYFVPGVIASLVMVVSLLLTSMAIVREREIGTMEQVIATPVTQIEFILGKTVPFAIMGYFNVAMIATIGVLWFKVPFRGHVLDLALGSTVYLMSTLGIGLLISTICRTQQQAMMSGFLAFNPAILLSGFMFPIANMPEVVQWFTYLNPLRYFLIIVREIFLKGVGLEVLWPEYLSLFVLGTGLLTLATLRFSKHLD